MKLPEPKRVVSGLFPILQWSRRYDGDAAIGDLIAGITIALTLIPQSIAYASLAGFQPQFGLYASFTGGFVYALMGTCPQINIGPTALLSLLTFTYTMETNPDFAILLCFIGGIVQLIAGVAQLGFLVEFVSLPVVSGFTSAAAITIASSQIKGLLGLKFSSEGFLSTWREVFQHISETRMHDTLLSLVCCIVLLGMKALKDIHMKDTDDEKGRKMALILKKTFWFAGVARNAIVVVLAAVVAFFLHEDKNNPLILTGNITPGLPTPILPPFHTSIGNTTFTAGDMFSHLGSGLLVVPLVGIISNVAIAKAFARGKTLDATQEIVALGACNVIGAFFRSYPVNGSFTRSAVSDASGVRTPAAGFYTGIIVLLTLALLTPYFYYIPRAALASVIVCAVLHMVDVAIIKRLWASSRLDLIPLVGSFICCLSVGIEIGLLCGVAIDVMLMLYYHSRPPLDVQLVDDGVLPPYFAVHPVGGLNFAGAERVRSKLSDLQTSNKSARIVLDSMMIVTDDNRVVENGNGYVNEGYHSSSHENSVPNGAVVNNNGTNLRNGPRRHPNVLVVYCDSLYRMDYTFLQSLKMLVSDWSHSGHIVWCNVRPYIKAQLNSIILDPTFCDTAQLGLYLTGISETDAATSSDTQL